MNQNYLKIKDASADLTLDYNLYLLGCSGLRRLRGHGYFKAPDKIMATMEGVTYFARGNRIRKIDEEGKKFYVKLINALDFKVGFHAGLLPHNFELTVIIDTPEEIMIEGIPKPGILKHVNRILFYVDPQRYVVEKMDLHLSNRSLSGKIYVQHEQIQGIWVPVGFHGQSAIEIRENALVGLGISLQGENIKINTGLPDQIFDPGF